MTRIFFLGTPDAAVPTFSALAERFDVSLVVTQPDRPKGRSGKPAPSAVKMAALDLSIEVAQPESASELLEAVVAKGKFDLGVVVAYGRILKPEILELPHKGLLNVHFSLLPRWRGAAPVERALMAGDPMSGVTIIKLDEGLDTGGVLTAQAVDIAEGENGGDLIGRLAFLGARLVADVIPGYLAGEVEPVPQTDEGLEYAAKITSEDRVLSIEAEPGDFVNRIRALAPKPGATLDIDGETFRILQARVLEEGPVQGQWTASSGAMIAGIGSGAVEITVMQPPGKKPMDSAAWLRGARKDQGKVA